MPTVSINPSETKNGQSTIIHVNNTLVNNNYGSSRATSPIQGLEQMHARNQSHGLPIPQTQVVTQQERVEPKESTLKPRVSSNLVRNGAKDTGEIHSNTSNSNSNKITLGASNNISLNDVSRSPPRHVIMSIQGFRPAATSIHSNESSAELETPNAGPKRAISREIQLKNQVKLGKKQTALKKNLKQTLATISENSASSNAKPKLVLSKQVERMQTGFSKERVSSNNQVNKQSKVNSKNTKSSKSNTSSNSTRQFFQLGY